ncbi:acyl-CoA synthetase [Mesorhizobium sp. BE184]|uniref:acyl-CoA synthetase n=1 Tax=Mesorhizobium sp. BE184 TaxID=2817714 RepID=UPI00286C8B14|nr:acyl-CoA synthetase [Mesorhizobium sp. BE184]
MMSDNPRGGVSPVTTRVMNLAQFLSQSARRNPDEIGFVWRDSQWTWREMEARVNAFAAALRDEYGVAKGDRVLIQSANSNQMFESMFACFRLGAVWVPANYRQSPDEVAYLAKASGARGMICGAGFAGHARACREAAQSLEFVVAIGEADFGPDYDSLVERHMGETVPAVAVDRDDPCWFFYTSGTTGRPKAAVLTHGQMAFVVTNHLCDLMPGTTHKDASIVVAPLSHGAGVHQLAQVAHGVKTIILPTDKMDVPTVWSLVETWRVSNIFTVPTIVKLLVEDASVDRFDRSSLRYMIYAGAPMYRADQKRALEKLGPVLVQYFGLGEVTGNITVLPPAFHSLEDGPDARIGTCGFERTGMEVQVQDDEGNALAAGETGEICTIGPAVFAGYYDNPDANAKAFRNGWFRTGDLGHMDENGFVYITGRSSDMYISGGSNIYPREIEEKILAHPEISEVAVLGVPDPMWGEVGVAVCVARAGANPDPRDIQSWLETRISRYKMPKRFIFWAEMPKSAYGKITKKMIREELDRRGELDPSAQKLSA